MRLSIYGWENAWEARQCKGGGGADADSIGGGGVQRKDERELRETASKRGRSVTKTSGERRSAGATGPVRTVGRRCERAGSTCWAAQMGKRARLNGPDAE